MLIEWSFSQVQSSMFLWVIVHVTIFSFFLSAFLGPVLLLLAAIFLLLLLPPFLAVLAEPYGHFLRNSAIW